MKDFLVSSVKYEETIKAPEQVEINKSSVRSMINSLSIIKNCSWEDAVKLLIKQAHKLCDSPINVTKEMLCANEFIKLPCNGDKSLKDELNKRQRVLPRDFKYIVKIINNYYALMHDGKTGNFIIKGIWDLDAHIENGVVKEMWIYIPGSTFVFGSEKTKDINKADKQKADNINMQTSSDNTIINNVNPMGRNTGDCFLRALSVAYGCSWHEALDYIAQAIKYADPIINQLGNFEVALSMLGFEKHKAIKNDNRRLNGVQFCEEMNGMYHNGERIVAIMGRGHCVAVTLSEDGTGYKINDTWASSCYKVYEYWVFKTAKSKAFQCGSRILHPTYGTGSIIKVIESGEDKAYITYFDKVGVKKISELWLKDKGVL